MKKLLMIMLLAFTALNSNASTVSNLIDSATATTKSIVNSTVNGAVDAKNFVDTSSNFRMMYNDGKAAIIALAKNLKVGVTEVLHIIGKKYFLMGIYAWVAVLTGIIIGVITLFKIKFPLMDGETSFPFFIIPTAQPGTCQSEIIFSTRWSNKFAVSNCPKRKVGNKNTIKSLIIVSVCLFVVIACRITVSS